MGQYDFIAIELPTPGMLDVTRHEVAAKIVHRAYTGYGMVRSLH